jgi:glycosyltransferase involved in cell wall biosynthesis
MQVPFFSIIIATYNRDKFIATAIQSVLDQTFTNWELIIIDDGSTDKSKEIIESFKDDRIKYYYQKNQERSIARNNGIKRATGEYICFLDSDDYYLPNHLQVFKTEIKTQNNINLILVANRSYEHSNIQTNVDYFRTFEDNLSNHILYEAIISSPPIQCICINRYALKTMQFKNDWLPYSECNQFSYDLLSKGLKYHYTNENSVTMVNHDSNTTLSSYKFYISKIEFIKHFSSKLKFKRNNVINTQICKYYIYSIDHTLSAQKIFASFIGIIKTCPARILSRSIWKKFLNKLLFS